MYILNIYNFVANVLFFLILMYDIFVFFCFISYDMKISSHNRGLQIPLSSAIEDIRNKSTAIFVQIKYMPLLIIFLLLSSIIICLIFFVIEDRMTEYIPTISEIATSFPNADIFSIFQAICAIFLTVLFTLYISAADTWNAIDHRSVIICRIIGCICPIFLILLSCFSLEENYYIHIISFVLVSFSFFAFFAITLLQMRNILVKSILLIRSIFLFIIFLSFISILIHTSFNTVSSPINAISQYVFFFFTGAFILSFSQDLSLVRLQVVTLDDDKSN